MKYNFPALCVAAIGMLAPFFLFPGNVSAQQQQPFKGLENLFTVPKNYVAAYVTTPPKIDGDLSDAAWQQAVWTDNFVDIEGDLKPKPPLQTDVKMLWDDKNLYIAAQISDPQVWATLTHHDDIVFKDNDFEIFIDPSGTAHEYFEMEYNAVNTVFDLFLNKPYRAGGTPLINWDAEGMQSAVKVQGTLNNPSDVDKGWTVEIAIPFSAIGLGIYQQAPTDGNVWRINFSRVEWDTKVVNGKYVKLMDKDGHNLPEHNWVWSPQGIINMHAPERFGYLKFSKSAVDSQAFTLPYAEQQKQYLWLVYYREKQWLLQHHSYTTLLSDLGVDGNPSVGNNLNVLTLEASTHQFFASITDNKTNITYTINHEGLVGQVNAGTK